MKKCRRCGKEIEHSSPIFGWCYDCYKERNETPWSEEPFITVKPTEEKIVKLENNMELTLVVCKSKEKKETKQVEKIILNDNASKVVEKITDKICSIPTEDLVKEFVKLIKKINKDF